MMQKEGDLASLYIKSIGNELKRRRREKKDWKSAVYSALRTMYILRKERGAEDGAALG